MKLLTYYPGNLTRATGTPIRTVQIIQSLANLGACIHLLADVLPPAPKIANIQYHTTKGAISPLQNLQRRTRDLACLIRKIQPDLVYGQTHGSLYAQVLACRITHTSLVIDLHNDLIAECNFSPIGKFIRRKLESFALKYTKGLTVVSSGLKEHYAHLGLPIEVIHGGTDTETFSPTVTPNDEIENLREKDTIIVAYVGNFRTYQGIDTLVTAAQSAIKANQSFLFVFVGGDTPQVEQEVRATIEKFNLKGYIHLLGKRPYEEIPSLLAASDILIVPRPLNPITRNAFPSKLPEYMAMGKAVIATNVGDTNQLIQSGKTGILVPPSDPEALTKAILDLTDTTLRRTLGQNAREFICETHSWSILGKKIHRFLESTL